MKILKFGGSSLATSDRIESVARIVAEARKEGPLAVVVSAFGGVTDALIAAADSASRHDEAYQQQWQALRQRHLAAAHDVMMEPGANGKLDGVASDNLTERLEGFLEDLRDLFHGVFLLRETSPQTLDSILSYGERMSSEVVAASLCKAGLAGRACDARRLIVTDGTFGNAQVDLETSYRQVCEEIQREEIQCEEIQSDEMLRGASRHDNEVAVITGFIAATPSGRTTTVGRGGSDYTAALVGAAVNAQVIELWTDVDGVMSADPRSVPGAFSQPRLSYAELMELSHFGAKVVYPPSVHPARSQGIPLVIKNTFNPTAAGTLVTETAPPGDQPIRGISAIHRVTLMRLEGDGMVGVPGIARRLFGALARGGVSIILISQSSSEHSICFAVSPDDAERARHAVEQELALERQAGIVDTLIVEEDQSVIAVVGEQMRQRPGLAGRLFGVLGEHAISVRAIAQGSSELNISMVIDKADKTAALCAIHDAFFAPNHRRVALAVAGVGHVGRAFLEQLRMAASGLAEREGLDIRVVALCNSRRMVIHDAGIDLIAWRQSLGRQSLQGRQRVDEEQGLALPLDAETFHSALREVVGAQRVMIDCTASDQMAASYEGLLTAGVSVIAANKLPFAGETALFEQLRCAARTGKSSLLYEASVGAGLPVLSTLQDMVRSGDRIVKIDGVLSGSVNSVLEALAVGQTFSQAVRDAHRKGFTEPHPWQDLSGGDVARKLCILSRLAGHALEMRDIHVEPVISGDWEAMSQDAFWNALPKVDEEFRQRSDEAAARGHRLRYVASLDEDGARVALASVPPEHPAHGLAGADNLVAFTTTRYRDSPLVLCGPGAGPEVTAAGVFADLLRAIDRRTA